MGRPGHQFICACVAIPRFTVAIGASQPAPNLSDVHQ